MSEPSIEEVMNEALRAAAAEATARLSQRVGLPPVTPDEMRPDIILDRPAFHIDKKGTEMFFEAAPPLAEPADGYNPLSFGDEEDAGRAIMPFDLFYIPAEGPDPEKTAVAYGLLIEQGNMEFNPIIRVPAEFAGKTFGDIIELNGKGKVWLQWIVDATSIQEVRVVVSNTPPDLIPYDPATPLVGATQYGYYVQIGRTWKEGDSKGGTPEEFGESDGAENEWNGHFFVDAYPDLGGASDSDHMWKVTSSGPAGGVGGDATYSVAGGVAVIQGTRVPVAAKPNLAASGGTGFVVLKVTRNSASRVYDPGNIPVIEFYTTVPPSTYAAEYTVLAETLAVTVPAVIPGDPPTYRHDIAQCRSDEICSYELLIVANGEFALLPVQANSRNSYAPPLP